MGTKLLLEAAGPTNRERVKNQHLDSWYIPHYIWDERWVGYIWILTTDRKWGQHIQVVRFSEVPVFGYYSLHVSSNKLFISGCPVGVRIDLRSSQ